MKINEKDNFNSLYLLALMHKHYRFIIGALIVAFLVSIVFSSPLFITPKYKSTVILFPSSSNSISKALLTDQVDLKQDILQYGEDDQIDQMLQVLASNRIRDRIIQKYNLLEHYDLRKSTYKYTKLYNEYEKNIKFRRTEFMAVSISVLDTDPQLAADIANEIAALYNSTCVQMQKDRAMQAFKIVEGTYLGLVNEIKVMEDSLAILRQLGVNDYETQSEMINQQLAIQVANNNQQGVRELQKQIDILAKYGTPYVSIRDQLDYDKQQLSLIKVKYEEAKIDAEQELSQKFVISEAYKAERKSYPIRWLIVVISVIATAIMAVLLVVILDGVIPSYDKFLTHFAGKKKNNDKGNQHVDNQPNNILEQQHIQSTANLQAKQQPVNINSTETADNVDKPHIPAKETYFDNINNENDMDNFFAAAKLWNVIWKRKIHLIIFTVIGVIVGVVFSSPFFITPKFKSTAIVYPSNIGEYSEESPTEQLMQWLGSQDIKNKIIEHYNLYEHYGISLNDPKHFAIMMYEYGKNVKIEQTEYEAVAINVIDKDPQTACNMVNSIIAYTNELIMTVQHDKFAEVVDVYEKTLASRSGAIDSVISKMETLGMDEKDFAALYSSFNMSNNNGSRQPNIAGVKPEYVANVLKLWAMGSSMESSYNDYYKAIADFSRDYTCTSVVSQPMPADKKCFPVRWIIVVLSAMAMFFISYVVFLVMENSHKIVKK